MRIRMRRSSVPLRYETQMNAIKRFSTFVYLQELDCSCDAERMLDVGRQGGWQAALSVLAFYPEPLHFTSPLSHVSVCCMVTGLVTNLITT